MATHTVEQGECLSSIAAAYGMVDWRTIYDHARNADFRKKRPDPNVIYPGDQLFIPAPELKEESGGTEAKHRFSVKATGTLFRLRLQDETWEPMADVKWKLEVAGQAYEGTTGGDGLIEKNIPATAKRALLTIWPHQNADPKGPAAVGYQRSFRLGSLDPVEYATGVQARLNNLGIDCGPVDGKIGPRTRAAIRAFQEWVGLESTGQADDATRTKLREAHDGV